jgi:hypothetical protein
MAAEASVEKNPVQDIPRSTIPRLMALVLLPRFLWLLSIQSSVSLELLQPPGSHQTVQRLELELELALEMEMGMKRL